MELHSTPATNAALIGASTTDQSGRSRSGRVRDRVDRDGTLWTVESGCSDMVLDARVSETQDGFSIEIHLVYVP